MFNNIEKHVFMNSIDSFVRSIDEHFNFISSSIFSVWSFAQFLHGKRRNHTIIIIIRIDATTKSLACFSNLVRIFRLFHAHWEYQMSKFDDFLSLVKLSHSNKTIWCSMFRVRWLIKTVASVSTICLTSDIGRVNFRFSNAPRVDAFWSAHPKQNQKRFYVYRMLCRNKFKIQNISTHSKNHTKFVHFEMWTISVRHREKWYLCWSCAMRIQHTFAYIHLFIHRTIKIKLNCRINRKDMQRVCVCRGTLPQPRNGWINREATSFTRS